MAGFLDDAEVDVSDLPDDPFGFGNQHWPLRLIDIGEPKVTQGGDKFGIKLTWAIEHQQFDGTPQAEKLGNGNWTQLPVPSALWGSVPWDKDSPEGKKVLFQFRQLLEAMGFKADEMRGVGPEEMKGRKIYAKVRAVLNPEGFWNFNLFQMKPFTEGSDDGMGEFAGGKSTKSAEDLLKEELDS